MYYTQHCVCKYIASVSSFVVKFNKMIYIEGRKKNKTKSLLDLIASINRVYVLALIESDVCAFST